MKKLLILFALPLLLSGCGKNAQSPSSSKESTGIVEAPPSTSEPSLKKEDQMNKEYVAERVNAIYHDVFTQYYSEDADLNEQDIPSPDEKYCTKEWKELLNKVIDYDNTHNPDDIGFFEADYWVMGQDFGDLSISDVNVVKLDDDDATVELNLHNLGKTTTIRLEMEYERNNWFIDNFVDVEYGISWKNDMEEYLKED